MRAPLPLRRARLGKRSTPRNGLVAAFGRRVVATGNLAAEHGGDLNKVQTLRELADYSGDPFDIDKAAWAVRRVCCCGEGEFGL
jgi:hypothetical protein